jgi:hypothetical protein
MPAKATVMPFLNTPLSHRLYHLDTSSCHRANFDILCFVEHSFCWLHVTVHDSSSHSEPQGDWMSQGMAARGENGPLS